MSDISNQLIKDSYNYILQSDLSTGVVYRIGGDIPVNLIFSSGLTINTSFNFSNGSEQSGYVLTSDSFGNAFWGPVSGSSSGDYLSLSGGTVFGPTIFTDGITANTFSSGTYYNLPVSGVTGGTGISANTTNGLVTIVNTSPDQTVTISGDTGISTGGSYPNFVLTNTAPDQTVIITGGTNIEIDGTYPNFGINFTGSTSISGDFLPLSGGTVSGATNFTDGLTANTISATTYQNLPPSSVKSINSVSINTDAGNNQNTDYIYFASNSITITLPTAISNTNSYVIKNVGTSTITINTTSSQTIDGSLTALINVQYLSLTLISDGANWNII
jgi:hypothetical protein